MVQITKVVRKYTPEISKQVRETVSEPVTANVAEISKTASDGISNLQKGLINIYKSKLDRSSEYCKFFGTDSAYNVQRALENQMTLSIFKSREQNIVRFPTFNIESAEDVAKNKKCIDRCMNKLKEQGAGRLSVYCKTFGEDGAPGTHTVGLIYDNGRILVLDSLSEKAKGVKEYHETFKNALGKDYGEIKFIDCGQQSIEDYTCNNWTHANIEAVLKYKAEKGDLNETAIKEILPQDINKILKEQSEYVTEKLNGRSLFDIMADEQRAAMKKAAK